MKFFHGRTNLFKYQKTVKANNLPNQIPYLHFNPKNQLDWCSLLVSVCKFSALQSRFSHTSDWILCFCYWIEASIELMICLFRDEDCLDARARLKCSNKSTLPCVELKLRLVCSVGVNWLILSQSKLPNWGFFFGTSKCHNKSWICNDGRSGLINEW